MDKRKYIYPEKLSSDDVFALLSEIPSDGSYGSDDTDDEEIINKNLLEIEEENEAGEDVNNNSDWEDEDKLPLTKFIKPAEKIKWSKTAIPQNLLPFSEKTGPNMPDYLKTPTEFFLQLFPEDLLQILVFQTNLYEVQQRGINPSPTSIKEMKCFLAINLLMGIKEMSSYKDFWSARPELRDTFISSIMSRDRFDWHIKNLHINDNTLQPKNDEPGYDKLYKIRPLLHFLGNTYKDSYFASKCQSIDESMVKFKGRSSLRQYMPLKPVKWGYKIWVRADETGYVAQFQIYTGKTDSVETNLATRVIKDLTRDLVGKNYEIYFDNYFNSVKLQKDLLQDGIYACGTLRKGRKDIPTDFVIDKNMKRGDSDWRMSEEGIVALKWIDKKPILFLSNFHNPLEEETVRRKNKDGTREVFSCLKMVKDYNAHMGYVDKSDMLTACYKLDRKSKKWWHRLFWHFLNLTVVNAFILFNAKCKITKTSMTLKEFIVAVINGLIGTENVTLQQRTSVSRTPSNRFKKQISLEKRTSNSDHMPIHGTKVRCTNCSTKAEPRRSRWHCQTCKVGLCLSDKRNCFLEFHKM